MRYIFISLSVIALAYVLACAIHIPLTVDEAWTYIEFVSASTISNVVNMDHPVANNHIFNSLLTKLFAGLSNSELSLRMPNILALMLYSFSAYSISQRLSANRWLQLCLFIALHSNISLLKFFAMSRGYGLSIAFMLFSISQLLTLASNLRNKYTIHLCLGAAVLSVYATFVTLHAATAIFMLAAFYQYSYYGKNTSKSAIKQLWPVMLYGLIAVALCIKPLLRLVAAEQFYWGGDKNFIDDTMFTMMQDIAGYNTTIAYRDALLAPTIILICIALLSLIPKLRSATRTQLAIPAILVWCLLCANIQFYVLGSKLLMHRTALFLFPLFVLSVFSAISIYHPQSKKLTYGVGNVIATALLWATLANMNLKPVDEWWFDADNKLVLERINAEPKTKPEEIKLLPYVFCGNSINYYIERKYSGKIIPPPIIRVEDVTDYLSYDYMYLPTRSYVFSEMDSFTVIGEYCDGKMALYKRK